ncbi:MAG: hypothetical protein KKH84_00145 [Proteobacteria bacterium]|nr:hypothetical protein [Pseudomonadota bacterium]MBU4388816.1 hypothetical protein [Pseudomonadota bacterium]MBU4419399.1 hypothetical protein [Pseudomonadota bacterium]MBU4504346.1 hypothetical protein [Pseudomonadota bacterium]MCG2830631.1 hypothetical protein [Desulfobacteraceae bacterium]
MKNITSELDSILKQYSSFEIRVGKAIGDICAKHCSVCSSVCCKPEFCRETIESSFLSLLNKKFPPVSGYSKKRGWLTATGCILSAGRPPVCYEYLCSSIMEVQPDDMHRYVINVLSMLVSHIGKYTLGRRHLIEILDEKELKKVKIIRFKKQLNEAKAAFNAFKSYIKNEHLDKTSLQAFEKIVSPPDSIIVTLHSTCQSVCRV